MINLRYVLHFSSCGYFCLKHIEKKGNFKRKGYMSLYEMKEQLVKHNYYCMCVRVKGFDGIKGKCVTLLNLKNSFHFVVIEKVEDDFIYFYDPLFLFVRKVKKSKFYKKWSKICLFYKKI